MADEGGSFQLVVITPQRTVFDGVVQGVTAPGFLGQFGVLPGHIPYITAMKPGLLTFDHEGQTHRYVLGHGFAEVGTERVQLLTERYEEAASIDVADATAQMQAAEKVMLEKEPSDPEYLDARASQEIHSARVIAGGGGAEKS